MPDQAMPPCDVQFLVQVDRAHSADQVADALRTCGLAVDRVLDRVGVIGGHGPRALGDTMRAVTGVRQVREEAAYQLPPRGPGIPQ